MSALTLRPPRSLSRERAAASQSRAALLVAGLLTLVALALRASQIRQSLLGDEIFTYSDIVGRSFTAVLSTVHSGGENSPPLFFLFAWATAKLGDPSVWLRLPSIVLGTATVPVVYAIGARWRGRRVGLVAAAILAIAPFTVYYGVEARPYASMTFFVALSTLALLLAVDSGRSTWWATYVLSSAAAAYCHYTCVFVLGVQAVWSLWRLRDRIRLALIANVLIGLLYLPWLPELRGKALATIGALYPLGPTRVLTDLLRPFPGHPSAPLNAIPTVPGLVLVGAALACGALALWQRRPGRASPTTVLILAGALATPVGLLLYSLVATDLWLPRGLSASLPAVALLAGALLTAPRGRLAGLTVAVVLGVLVFAVARSLTPAYTRGPYRTISAVLDRAAAPADPILLVTYSGAGPIQEEMRHPHRVQVASAPLGRLRAGEHVFAIVDDLLLRDRYVSLPSSLRHLRLISRRHYAAGLLSTDVLEYAAAG